MNETFVAHNLTEFFAWLTAPQDLAPYRRAQINFQGFDVEDLIPFLACNRWNYTVHTVSVSGDDQEFDLVLKREEPVPDDQIEAVQARFEDATTGYITIVEE